ncbi:MAG: phage tail protein [Pseudobacteriovorax sp.]|nr:phage tail protein [Pseudobacteriovorax sp.]
MKVQLAIGPAVFEVGKNVIDKIERSIDTGWKSKETLSGIRRFNTGVKSIDVVINGYLYPRFGASKSLIDLENQASRPLLVIDGEGNNFGLWVVTRIKANNSFFIGGSPQKKTYTINMSRYDQ